MATGVQPVRPTGPGDVAEIRTTAPALRPRLVERPRLLDRLRGSASAPVIVIHAPAGYGKTTLLAQWAATESREVTWLTLEPADDDAVTIAQAVAAALDRTAPVPDDVFAALRGGPGAVVPLALPRIGRALGLRPRPFVLILDDVQHVASERACDVVNALLAHVPDGSQVVLCGRTRPHVPLARLRAEGRLVELSAAELRMTAQESAAVLRASGVDLPDAEAVLVAQRTEGWPAAVYLSSVILRDPRQRAEASAVTGDDVAIADYFREQVIAGAPPEALEFLTGTAILDHLSAPLCDAVLGRSDSAARLRALAEADLFVMPLDRRDGGYRVHQLFREHLLARLRREQPDLEPVLQRRASAWCADAGDVEGAIRHALDAGDRERAAAMLWQVTPQYESQGRSATLQRWLTWFTPADVRARPSLALTAGWSQLDGGDGSRAAEFAAIAAAAGRDDVLADGSPVAALTSLLEAAIAENGIAEVQAAATRASELLPADSPLHAICLLLRGAAAQVTGEAAAARELLVEGVRVATLHDIPSPRVICLGQLALLDVQEDRWDHAHELMHRARTFQHRDGLRDYATQAGVFAVSALVHAQRGDRGAAQADALTTAKLLAIQRAFIPWLGAQARWVLADAHLRLGEVDAARTYAAEARREVRKDPGSTFLKEQIDLRCAAIEQAASGGEQHRSLTTAELRTLQYLPTHLSLREVGDRLYVSRNTVKTHTVSIYRKLGATSRSEAVERARELGLIESA